ncbi:MAG: shikimate kinase [Oculatellaceae cyanobacterium bins.114]|nr:shikimate kinase [Oculatellaceae cyanobacterium bins.114]
MLDNQPLDGAAVNRLLKGSNLYLIGMMGSGKSTVGRLLAMQLKYKFLDTDTVIEQLTQKSISQIFADSGEATFREIETQVLGRVAAETRTAIATGGGIVLQRQNWSYLHHGIVVWLDVPVDQLLKRLKGSSNRPLLNDPDPQQKLHQILEQRQPLYATADVRVRVEADESSNSVASKVLYAVAGAIQAKLAEQSTHPHN